MATKGYALIDATTNKIQETVVPYLDNQMQVLGSASVDLLSTGTTLLYTVPTGKTLMSYRILTLCTASDSPGFSTQGTIGSNNPDYNNLLFNFFSIPVTVGTFTDQGEPGSGGQIPSLAAGTEVYVNITTADGGTDLDVTFLLIGFLI